MLDLQQALGRVGYGTSFPSATWYRRNRQAKGTLFTIRAGGPMRVPGSEGLILGFEGQ